MIVANNLYTIKVRLVGSSEICSSIFFKRISYVNIFNQLHLKDIHYNAEKTLLFITYKYLFPMLHN